MTSTRHQPQTNLPDNKQFQITKNALLDPVSSFSLEIFGGNFNLPAPQLVPLLYSGVGCWAWSVLTGRCFFFQYSETETDRSYERAKG